MNIFGIDPGWKGGIAVINNDGDVLYTTKMAPRGALIYDDLCHLVSTFDPAIVVIEQVGSRKTDARTAAFSFGRNFEAICLSSELCRRQKEYLEFFAPPEMWQKPLGVYALKDKKGKRLNKTDKKNYHKEVAAELFPDFEGRITHAIADAMLLAWFGKEIVPKL